jgi:serine/threonine protein kinase
VPAPAPRRRAARPEIPPKRAVGGAGTRLALVPVAMNTPQDLIGRTLQGKFVITDVLGEGSMGVVYRGFDEATLDEVAIKVLQPSLADNEEVVTRFHREAVATRRVDHEGTVRVLGRGCEAGIYYLVMELLHGKSLAAVLDETRRLPEGRAARIVIQLCGALAVAHQRRVVHRDIKPENIMVIEGGDQLGERVKLLDFGIAKRLSPAQPLPAGLEDSFGFGEDTRHGALIGTPEYMAPEQCMGRDVDERTDLYACGVLLYRMVTGQVPFDGTGVHPFELCQRHIGEDPLPPRELAPWLKPEMEAIILKALRKAPSARHQSADELRGELARVLASIEQAEMEPTEPFLIEDLVLAEHAKLLAADLAAPVPVVFQVSMEEVAPRPEAVVATVLVPAEVTRLRTRRRRRHGYLPTVALVAVIGAGLGSLFMALAPLVMR